MPSKLYCLQLPCTTSTEQKLHNLVKEQGADSIQYQYFPQDRVGLEEVVIY